MHGLMRKNENHKQCIGNDTCQRNMKQPTQVDLNGLIFSHSLQLRLFQETSNERGVSA